MKRYKKPDLRLFALTNISIIKRVEGNGSMDNNLFLPVYRNIEKEVETLCYSLHCDDKQTSVYSMKIAELLVRCCVEIESLSKKLYFDNGGIPKPANPDGSENFLQFDSDCINHLNSIWYICSKKVLVVGVGFFFELPSNKELKPLYNANKTGNNSWKKAYMAIKHDRQNNLEKATIKNLIGALAALYLLNVYNTKNSPIDQQSFKNMTSFDCDSTLFSVKVANIGGCGVQNDNLTGMDFQDATYLYKYKEQSYEGAAQALNALNAQIKDVLFNSFELKESYKHHGNSPQPMFLR